MNTIWLLLLFPLVWPFIAKRIWDAKITWSELALSVVVVSILTTGTHQLGKYGQTIDYEIWNGVITSKNRDHGTYEQAYDCNCVESCSGSGNSRSCSTTCQTCYETHYTVTWTANSTAGNMTFDHKDSTWRSVYASPDPTVYKKCEKGQPASRTHKYTNYVQAVPNSLFNDDSKLAEQFAGNIPKYPEVYGFYRLNRVVNVGAKVPPTFVKELNTNINNTLRTVGPKKQVNVVVVLTSIPDPSYRYAVENAWQGGEKNDVVVFIGTDGNTILWSDVMTWAHNSGNELFHVKLRDGIKATAIDPTAMGDMITSTIWKHFDRPEMAAYEYLQDEIEPPLWVLCIAIFFSIGGPLFGSWLFHRTNIDFFKNVRYRRRMRNRR